jgi:hypothetical protein
MVVAQGFWSQQDPRNVNSQLIASGSLATNRLSNRKSKQFSSRSLVQSLAAEVMPLVPSQRTGMTPRADADPVRQTGQWLKSIVHGHFNYYAVPGNLDSLSVFRDRLIGQWANTSPPQPKTPDLLDPYSRSG